MDTYVVTLWAQTKAKVKSLRSKKRFSFITIHYMYMVGMTIVGSILLFPAGNLAYIDALFFAAGACTQSGLNTVDINKLNTYQQVILYLIAMVTNVVAINTFVVFVRLYWFEKRFQHVVREAMSWRRTRSRSRTETKGLDGSDAEKQSQGVNGRSIVVLDKSGKPLGHSPLNGPSQEKDGDDPESSSSSRHNGHVVGSEELNQQRTDPTFPMVRNITFADDLASPNRATNDLLPQRLNTEQHIAFLERQRNPQNNETLIIPGPRESDRGQKPEAYVPAGMDGEDLDRHITVDTSNNFGRFRARSGTGGLGMRKSGTMRSQGASSALERAPSAYRQRRGSGTFSRAQTSATKERPTPYLSWQPTIGRNSAFVDLTEEQREELGGIEYRSLKLLAVILLCYFFGWHLLGVISFTPWIMLTDPWGSIVDSDGISRAWWGIFTPATLFNDLGFTLTPDSMISFQYAVWPLLLGSFLIVIGNTGFPCLLRFTLWLTSKFSIHGTSLWEELHFLLDHPRRCFTLLFPSSATWVLFEILIILNGLDLIFFIILDLNDPTVTNIPPGLRVLNGLFQAVSTRTSGTAVVNLADLHPGIQVSYLIMMYISVFPIAISVRRTNVYEEKSLGIYNSSEDEDEDTKEPSYVGAHLRRQLSFDLWFIFLGLFIIAVADGPRLQDPNDEAFNLFSCLFEIVSAYGTVGLSLGYPTINASFSAELGVVSKLVIAAMMIRGRHRGLPYELDRAILLPSEGLHKKEDEDAAKRKGRRRSDVTEADVRRALGDEVVDGMLEQQMASPRSISSRHSNSYASPISSHTTDPRRVLGEALASVASQGRTNSH